MARRMVIGQVGGVMDMRISRPGVDAFTGDINDRRQISFSLLRDGMARVSASGKIYSVGQWVGFPQAFASVPPLIFAQILGNSSCFEEYKRQTFKAHWIEGNPFVGVVSNTGVMIARTAAFYYDIPAGDGFVFMAVG